MLDPRARCLAAISRSVYEMKQVFTVCFNSTQFCHIQSVFAPTFRVTTGDFFKWLCRAQGWEVALQQPEANFQLQNRKGLSQILTEKVIVHICNLVKQMKMRLTSFVISMLIRVRN